jgi:hypothetical protein
VRCASPVRIGEHAEAAPLDLGSAPNAAAGERLAGVELDELDGRRQPLLLVLHERGLPADWERLRRVVGYERSDRFRSRRRTR